MSFQCVPTTHGIAARLWQECDIIVKLTHAHCFDTLKHEIIALLLITASNTVCQ